MILGTWRPPGIPGPASLLTPWWCRRLNKAMYGHVRLNGPIVTKDLVLRHCGLQVVPRNYASRTLELRLRVPIKQGTSRV